MHFKVQRQPFFDKIWWKNYYCNNHYKPFEKFCFTCNKDLCQDCENEHSEHKIASYDEMTINIADLKESLKEIQKSIETFEDVIENIKYNLEGTKRIYKRYYDISNDIINKFELFNKNVKNYKILRTIWNLKFSNKQILEDLKKINEKYIKGKCATIIEIYVSKEDLYKGKEINVSTKNLVKKVMINGLKKLRKINKINKKRKKIRIKSPKKENKKSSKEKIDSIYNILIIFKTFNSC